MVAEALWPQGWPCRCRSSWALSGSFVGKWFSDLDEFARIAVTFAMAAAVVVPVALAIAYAQSGLQISTDLLPAIALLAAGTISRHRIRSGSLPEVVDNYG